MSAPDIASAYDAIAADYDRQVRGDEWMRRVLWKRYLSLFGSGQRVLDVSCGTGVDAVFLASHGIQVVGLDVSPGMIQQLVAKIRRLELADRIEPRVMDVVELAALPAESFDGIVSAFAGLNTIPNLAPFAAEAARLLRPGGQVMLHLLNRSSLWEWLGLIARGRWSAARHLGDRQERRFAIGGRSINHFLFLPDGAYRQFFAEEFRLQRAYSLGCLRPPHTVRRVPAPLVSALGSLERRLGHRRPFVNWGRFFVLEMEKR